MLRPFSPADVPELTRLAGDRDVAGTTLLIPHPYLPRHAEEWISGHQASFEARTGLPLAVTPRDRFTLIGAVGLKTDFEHARAELGFWVGKPFWGRGFATEAAKALVAYGFEVMDLHRVYAHHYPHNPASGRVLEKIGMVHEGRLRQHVRHWGVFEDLMHYGMIRSDGAWRTDESDSVRATGSVVVTTHTTDVLARQDT